MAKQIDNIILRIPETKGETGTANVCHNVAMAKLIKCIGEPLITLTRPFPKPVQTGGCGLLLMICPPERTAICTYTRLNNLISEIFS